MARRSPAEIEQDTNESAFQAGIARKQAALAARTPEQVAATLAAAAVREAAIAQADSDIRAAEIIIRRARRGSPKQLAAGERLRLARAARWVLL